MASIPPDNPAPIRGSDPQELRKTRRAQVTTVALVLVVVAAVILVLLL